jgi:hypothetical protein
MRYLKTMIRLVSIVILSSTTTAIIVYVATFQSTFRLDAAMPVVYAGGRSVLARLARSWCADIYSVQVYFSRPDHLAPDPNIRDMPDYLALSQTAKFDPRPVSLLVHSLFYKSPVKYEVDIGWPVRCASWHLERNGRIVGGVPIRERSDAKVFRPGASESSIHQGAVGVFPLQFRLVPLLINVAVIGVMLSVVVLLMRWVLWLARRRGRQAAGRTTVLASV